MTAMSRGISGTPGVGRPGNRQQQQCFQLQRKLQQVVAGTTITHMAHNTSSPAKKLVPETHTRNYFYFVVFVNFYCVQFIDCVRFYCLLTQLYLF